MNIRLLCVGQKMPHWVMQGVETYMQRLRAGMPIQLIEIPAEKRSKTQSTGVILAQEGQRILSHIQAEEHVILLAVTGASWTTAQLASRLAGWQQNAKRPVFVIGGPEGVSDAVVARANLCWSLSALTLPHPLVRVICVEQLYRAWSILNHHPYHRA